MTKSNWSKATDYLIIPVLLFFLIRGCMKSDEVQTTANYWNHYSDSVTRGERKLECSNDSLGRTIQVHDSSSKVTIDSLKAIVDIAKKNLNQKIRDIAGMTGRIRSYERNNDTTQVYIACDSLMGELTVAHYMIVYYQEMADTAQLTLQHELLWRDTTIARLQLQIQGFKEAYASLQRGCSMGMAEIDKLDRRRKTQVLLARIGWGIAALLGGKILLR